ncbi:prolipoprotein diacylglyceryl transferase [Oceaniferula spumae]|uniref:prolipoprotein diacylglyceryl transferase n=1 Tax=Oceaniferula spumae TaxID=2979115 RepID=UPI003F4F2452
MLATYIHNMDPVIFDVAGPVKLRWYGLGYLLGFVLAFYLLRWLARKQLWVLPSVKVADFIAYSAVFGVFLGGRIGYILFYQIPKKGGWDQLMDDPMMVFRVWDGGMASHGGILGLMIFTLVYARMQKVSWTGVGDGLCVVAPIGIGLVRVANFINGELYGRVAHGVSWAMKFPSSLHEDWKDKPEMIDQAYEACRAVDPSVTGQSYEYLVAQARENPQLAETLGTYLKARHPSQLYEALLEGLVLFLILIITRIKFPKLPHGILTGMFFLFYAIFRIIVEHFREPDVGQSLVLGLTKGQFYSTFMVIAGIGFIITALRKGNGSVRS